MCKIIFKILLRANDMSNRPDSKYIIFTDPIEEELSSVKNLFILKASPF
jgi:hypothetical protein